MIEASIVGYTGMVFDVCRKAYTLMYVTLTVINTPCLRGINNSLYRGTKAPVLYSYNEGKVNLVRVT